MIALALLLAAAAAALLPREGESFRLGARRRLGRTAVSVGAVMAAVGLAWSSPTRIVLLTIAAGIASGCGLLVSGSRRARVADRRRALVVEACEDLVGELRAGVPPPVAIAHAADVWPELGQVSAAARLGADVPDALRELSRLPGGEGAGEVASAWQISERSGAALSLALAQVAASARSRQATRRLVHSELASAQATARMVAALPLVALGMASGMGADPWHFLFDTAAGLACLGVGVMLTFLGLWWIDRIAAKVLVR